MTYQDFNHIYYTFTKNEKGIRPYDKITTTGDELKEFLEHAMRKINTTSTNQLDLNL
jgi:hypothetical protein